MVFVTVVNNCYIAKNSSWSSQWDATVHDSRRHRNPYNDRLYQWLQRFGYSTSDVSSRTNITMFNMFTNHYEPDFATYSSSS